MAHQRNFCICKPWSSPPALSWASLLCPHYVGRTRLFRILRRMSTQVALGVLNMSNMQWTLQLTQCIWTGTHNTCHIYMGSLSSTHRILRPVPMIQSACMHFIEQRRHTHFSLRNLSTLSHGNDPISLFFSFKWNNILNYTKAPSSIFTKLSQSLHHKPFLFLTGLCIIASTGSLQRSPTAETTLPFQFYEPPLMSPDSVNHLSCLQKRLIPLI